jgi:hypothetical protein
MTDSAERAKKITLRNLRRRVPSPLIPEMREEIMKKEMGPWAQFIDGVLPVSVQRVLARMLPGNEIMQRLVSINDFRTEHQIPVSRNPLR